VILAATSLALMPTASSTADEPLAERFSSPPLNSRILKIIHSWPDDSSAQDAMIAQLTRQGFGGVVCNVSFEEYLQSQVKWNAFQRAVTAAKKAGWTLWLYDERGYPSGNAGGLVLRGHPDWEAQGLLIADAATSGAVVDLEAPPGKVVLAAAFPLEHRTISVAGRRDLTGQVRDRRLRWSPPPGRWRVLILTLNRLYEGTHAEGNLAEKMPYINLLMPEPTRRFLELTHQEYANRLGADLGRDFVATFTDEPSLMSLFLRRMPYRVLPWAPGLADEFLRRRGYALEPILPELVLDSGDPGRKHRYDFWLTVGELVSENYFGQIQKWCREHGLDSGGHLLMEESLAAHVPLYGDFFRCARRLDAPSMDCLSSLPPEVPWQVARLLASAAEVEGRTLVMCETSDHVQRYRPKGDSRPVRDVSESEIRGTCNRLLVGGVNCITSYYSFAGLGDEAIHRLNEWVGRCCTMLRGGHQVADIALVYPIESIWPGFVPSHEWTHDAHEAAKVEAAFRDASETLFRSNREFTIIDSRTLREASPRGDALEHGSSRWRVVVLPAVDTLPLEAWEKLARFVGGGGVVVAIRGMPRNSEVEFPSTRVQTLGRQIFGEGTEHPRSVGNPAGGGGIFLPAGSESLLSLALRGVLEPDVTVDAVDSPVRTAHRRIDGHDIYFVINDSPRPWKGILRIAGRGEVTRWDPATGSVTAPSPEQPLEVPLEGYGATLLRSTRVSPPRRHPLRSGDLPGLVQRPLPLASPVLAHGEFVRARLENAKAGPEKGQQRFLASATVTRGAVDSHLLVRFPRLGPIRLGASDCLVVDTWVPEGQRTRTRLVVIVHEDGGGDFLASTPRSFGNPGHERSFVPLSEFQLAGWSRDPDGLLDPARITDISVGWGGYLGSEGEHVEFQLVPPQAGSPTSAPAP
jgi:hypothetical protein